MKINSFKAEGVHDYLRWDLNFFPDLTFLIGINGSGKTSALKLILGLTSPAFQYLNQINYQFCEVICSSAGDERNIIIRADQNKSENTFTLSITINGSTTKTEPIKRFLRNESTIYDNDELSQMEQRHKEAFEDLAVTKKIREIATPKFLGLDRRIYEGTIIDQRYRNRRQFLHPKYRNRNYDGFPEPQAIDVSLEEVQSLVFDYIRQIPRQQLQISDDFKQKMFSQSFEFVEAYNVEVIPATSAIISRKQNVLNAIENLGFDYYTKRAVTSFFNKVENITLEYEKFKNVPDGQEDEKKLEVYRQWYNNGHQLKRIDDIIRYSQEYQAKIAELRAPFKKLEELTTNFLKEGKKELHIEPDGEIKVNLRNGNSSSIYSLSSGEKQIIIMIAHLIFEEAQKTSGIFIIDEPELSLHIAWQIIFVESIMAASPTTQFILATHSPSIIAKVDKEKYCQDLNKFNS